MRLSCNGCRVLRKGCTADCSIRPCLQWIKSPKSQANATLFLAKFYGRAGLIHLINAASPHLRPAAFKSLLHEACGRIVNPIFGSTGLLSSGSWHLCEAAVEAVLIGAPIKQVSTSESASMFNAGDIRHVAKSGTSCASVSDQLHKVKSRSRFKRTAQKPKPRVESAEFMARSRNEFDSSVSHDSASGVNEHKSQGGSGSGSVGGEADSTSVETVEASQLAKSHERADDGDLELELTLGWGPVRSSIGVDGSDADTYKSPLGFLLPS